MDDNNLSKLKKFFKIVGTLLLAVSSIAVVVGLGRWGISYYWFLMSPIFGIAFYMLAPRSWRIASLLKYWFPVANELIHRQEQVDYNTSVVEKMAYTLRFYDLPDIDKVEGLRSRLINSLPEVDTDSGRLENCARNTAKHLKRTNAYLPAKLLMLLYQDHHSFPPIVLWAEEKANLIPDVAEVLRTSRHLQSRQYKGSYRKRDLECLLSPLQAFTLKQVKEEIEGLNEIWSNITRYLIFLTEHGVAHRMELKSPGDVLDHLKEDELPIDPNSVDRTIIRLLLATGSEAIEVAFPDLSDKLRISFCRISLILFFLNRSEMKAKNRSEISEEMCREAGNDEDAIRITFAYLEFKEDLRTMVELDGKRFVSLSYLIRNWAGKVTDREKNLPEGFQKEIEWIRETLLKGEWVSTLPYMIQEIIEGIKVVDTKMDQLIADRPFVQESLKRVFKDLRLETVERYLEARTINAYLITFRSEGGSVARLLNCIHSDAKQPELEALGISTRMNGLRKYNYKQYTDNGRIGVIPKGLSFEEFQRIFQEDFEKVVNSRRKLVPLPAKKSKAVKQPEDTLYWDWDTHDLENMELIVHRFGLSGRNYFGFIKIGITEDYAKGKIRELLADILSEDDLRALINYEKDEPSIVEAVIDGPITELIGDRVTLSPAEIKVLEKIDQELRSESFYTCGCGNAKELGRYLLGDKQKLDKATVKVAKKLETHLVGKAPQFDASRCRLIAEWYLETLKAIAGITA